MSLYWKVTNKVNDNWESQTNIANLGQIGCSLAIVQYMDMNEQLIRYNLLIW